MTMTTTKPRCQFCSLGDDDVAATPDWLSRSAPDEITATFWRGTQVGRVMLDMHGNLQLDGLHYGEPIVVCESPTRRQVRRLCDVLGYPIQ